MAIKWETVKAGDLLFDVHSTRAGNTTMRTMGTWTVRVVSIDHEGGTARVIWNGNSETSWPRRLVEKLRRKRPELEATVFGTYRIKRRAKK